MCSGNSWGDNIWWLIIIVILIWCCCGNGLFGGSNSDCSCDPCNSGGCGGCCR